MRPVATPADLLFWADEVRRLGQIEQDQVAKCASLIARYIESAAQQLLVNDVTDRN